MGKKRIAMVEEATGKGYEVSIGTFIGKNQGKVTEINGSSITVTELVKDFKGKLKEQTQEIKLHKNDDEEWYAFSPDKKIKKYDDVYFEFSF